LTSAFGESNFDNKFVGEEKNFEISRGLFDEVDLKRKL
jgi:hypothetical protein